MALVLVVVLGAAAAVVLLPRDAPALGHAPPRLSGAPALAGLDRTGSLLPPTVTAPPPGAVFLSPAGRDGGAGTEADPVRTLAEAYALAPSGGTVVARGGTYRDGGLDTDEAVSLQAFPGEQPWFDGTDVVTGWTSDGAGHWYVPWSTPDFCRSPAHPDGGYYSQVWPWQGTPAPDGPCVHADMANDPAGPTAADPQMVFADGAALAQVTDLAAVTAGSFWHDVVQRRVYVGTPPEGRLLEVTRRPHALVLRATSGLTVRGVGFRRYATNQKHEASTTHGALVVVGTPDVTVVDSVFTRNAGAGMNVIGGPPRLRVERSVFVANGFNGLDANGSQDGDDWTIRASVFDRNNTELFGRGCSESCTAAGAKLAHVDGLTVTDSVFSNNQGVAHGLWCDLHCSRTTVTGSVFAGNGNVGLFYEVSETGLLAGNLVHGNGWYLGTLRPDGTGEDPTDKGAGIRVSASGTRVWNNTVVDNVAGIVVYDDGRSPGAACDGCSRRAVGPDTRDVEVVNNLVSGASPLSSSSWLVGSVRRVRDGVPGTDPAEYYAALGSNTYHRAGGRPEVLHLWWSGTGSPLSFPSSAAVRAAHGLDSGSQDLLGGPVPFADPAAGDYCVRTGIVEPGRPLPDDLALPVPSSGPVPRGAPGWLGRACPGPAPDS